MLLGDHADVEERHHLTELHRGALHRPERRDDLLGGLQLAPRHRLLGCRLAARDVGRARAELLDRLARRQRGYGAVRRTREVGIFSLSRAIPPILLVRSASPASRASRGARGRDAAPLDPRARHDVV